MVDESTDESFSSRDLRKAASVVLWILGGYGMAMILWIAFVCIRDRVDPLKGEFQAGLGMCGGLGIMVWSWFLFRHSVQHHDMERSRLVRGFIVYGGLLLFNLGVLLYVFSRS